MNVFHARAWNVTDVMDVPNEINGLNARGWVSFPFWFWFLSAGICNPCGMLVRISNPQLYYTGID